MSTVQTPAPTATALRVLDTAERLVQLRGYNGFSYADIAAELDLTTASVHYHYRTKAELGAALIDRYAERFALALEAIDAGGDSARSKLDAYIEIYAEVLERGRMCLCGILAADYQTLPQAMRESLRGFFADNERWLTGVLEDGRAEGSLSFAQPARDAAKTIFSGLEGAMLVARPTGDIDHFRAVARCLMAAAAS